MRNTIIADFFKDHDKQLKDLQRNSITSAIDLAILKELLIEKKIYSQEEYEKKIKEKSDFILGKQPNQETKTETSQETKP
jgi:uncharacterized Rossmann fold enzyme